MNDNIPIQRLEADYPVASGPPDQVKTMKPLSFDQDINDSSRAMMRKEVMSSQVRPDIIKEEERLSKELPSSG